MFIGSSKTDENKEGKAKLVFLKHIRSAGGALGHYKPKTCLLKGILIIHKRKLQSLSSASIFFFLVFGERLIRVSIITCAVQIMQLLKHAVNTLEITASYLDSMLSEKKATIKLVQRSELLLLFSFVLLKFRTYLRVDYIQCPVCRISISLHIVSL